MSDLKAAGTTRMMLLGIALIVAGVLSIASPAVAGEAVMIVIGAMLTLVGTLQVIHGVRGEGLSEKMAPLVLGSLMTLGGLSILAHPLLGLETLALILAIFFIIEGIWKIVTSFSYRPASAWWALFISGALGFGLGWLIWRQWPLSGLWAVGVLVGVDLLTTGVAFLTLSMTIRHLKRTVGEAIGAQ